jgi:hypothetical protein
MARHRVWWDADFTRSLTQILHQPIERFLHRLPRFCLA